MAGCEMNKADKNTLTSNRSYLVQNISRTMDVVDRLMDDNIITDGMRQDIQAERTADDQNRKLLDIIPRRGPGAFQGFLKALVLSGNGFAAERICPGAGDRYSDGNPQTQTSNIVLPKAWPTEDDCVTDFEVKKCSDAEIGKWNSEMCYKMRRKPRGRVLLFNNFVSVPHKKKIDGEWKIILDRRYGTERDAKCLENLFEQLHFDVEVKKDRKADQMRKDIEEEKAHPFHKSADCFIVVFLSHGSSDGIYGIDGEVLPTAEVKSTFNNRNFSCMTGKPKLIFIQACRGDIYDHGATVADNVADAKAMAQLNLKEPPEPVDSDQPDSKMEKSPSNADMFVAHSTTQGNVSFRNEKKGSWFIQALVYVFRNYACREELQHMCLAVNELVSKGRGYDRCSEQTAFAVSEVQGTLRQQLYFFPGLTETPVHSPEN